MKIFEKIADKIIKHIDKNKKFLYYQIKAYRYNNYDISKNIGFLYNFASLEDEIDFIIVGGKESINLLVKVPENISKYFINCFYANFPDSELEEFKEKKYINLIKSNNKKYIKFKGDIKYAKDFQQNGNYLDPFKDILSIWENLSDNDKVIIYYDIRFVNYWDIWDKISNFIISIFNKNYLKDKDMLCAIWYSISTSNEEQKKLIDKGIKTTFRKFTNKDIKISKNEEFHKLSFDQFSNFFHILNNEYYIKNLDYLNYKKLASPINLPNIKNTDEKNLNILGVTDYKHYNIKFGIKEEDKLRHCYIIGKTGMGKSTLISNMVIDDLKKNKGVCVIDPHGDLIDTVLSYVPSWRINDVILFDVSDFNYPIGFNILQYQNEEEKNILVSGIVATFKKLYDNSWGPRLEYILRNSLLAIIEYPNATLLHLTRMLTDKDFLLEVLDHVKDPIVLKFFKKEFLKWNENFRNEAVSPIVNKVGQFLSSPIVRNIFGQTQTKLNIRKIMDKGKILLINLSKGKIGEDNANMIGSFFVTKIQIDAMTRADMNFKNRKDFYLYIDEFQNFATDSFESILSEARKYKLSLTIANQYINQIPENIKNAIWGNVGTIVSFGIGYEDSQIVSKQFKEIIIPNDLLSLPKFKAYIKLMIDGVVSDPFSMKTFPLPEKENGPEIKNKIRKQTQQSFASKKEIIEKKIKIWSENNFSKIDKAIKLAKNISSKEKDNCIESSSQLDKNKLYEGIIKLKYNYGVIVTLKGGKVEGLLHKKKMQVPEGLKWKEYYNIGDKIKVKLYKVEKNEKGENIEFSQL